jgi:hypothetical protein
MPKLRDDLLRNLSPDDQALMKIFRRRPLKAYTLKELLPKNAGVAAELVLALRLEFLKNNTLIMEITSEGVTYFAKAKGRPKKAI